MEFTPEQQQYLKEGLAKLLETSPQATPSIGISFMANMALEKVPTTVAVAPGVYVNHGGNVTAEVIYQDPETGQVTAEVLDQVVEESRTETISGILFSQLFVPLSTHFTKRQAE